MGTMWPWTFFSRSLINPDDYWAFGQLNGIRFGNLVHDYGGIRGWLLMPYPQFRWFDTGYEEFLGVAPDRHG